MDEGTVALIAAGSGVLGSILGAAGTVWATKAGAHKSAEAVRGQTQDQAANEHAHWLRQQRLAACEGFLDAWDECTRMRKELTRPTEESQHNELRAELSRAASRMLERAKRIEILGPDEVSQAAQSISEATLENIEREDKFGDYMKSAVVRVREQASRVQEVSPGLPFEQLNEVLRHADDLQKLQELYSIEELEQFLGNTEHSMSEAEEWICRATALGELQEEVNDESSRFLEGFKHNIQLAEENRAVFVRTVRESIASPPARNG
ncbi:hypothetical protein [Streptomyces sp. NBC_00519]|uniref:hypothetical protein n=1 Tax=Streptomyces sp. NBC_00519 TaxID=2975764 RepID=UPI0030DE3004